MSDCAPGTRHYEVVSPLAPDFWHGWDEPPEPFRCWVVVLASSPRAAVVAALRTDEFWDHLLAARSDGVNPYARVKATLAPCPHGRCFWCDTDQVEGSTACAECDECPAAIGAEYDEECLGPEGNCVSGHVPPCSLAEEDDNE